MGDIFDQAATNQPRLKNQLPPPMMSGGGDVFDEVLPSTKQAARQIEANPPGIQAPSLKMEMSNWGVRPEGSTYSGPGAWPNPDTAADAGASTGYRAAVGLPMAAAATAMGGPPAVRAIGGFTAKHPLLSTIAIAEARKLPGIGRFIPPYAEMLPYLRGGSKPAPEPTPAAEAAEAEGTAAEAANPSLRDQVTAWRSRSVGEQGVPYRPESHSQATMSQPEAESYMQGREEATGQPQETVGIDLSKTPGFSVKPGPRGSDWVKFHGEVEESAVSRPSLIEQMGGKPPETITERGPSEAYYSGPKQVIGPKPGSPEDIAETKSLKEQVREAAEKEGRTILSQEKRDWFARNQPGTTKGELTGAPEKPVRYTKTPSVASKARPAPGTVVPGPEEDLTPLLRKSLKQAMKDKAEREQ